MQCVHMLRQSHLPINKDIFLSRVFGCTGLCHITYSRPTRIIHQLALRPSVDIEGHRSGDSFFSCTHLSELQIIPPFKLNCSLDTQRPQALSALHISPAYLFSSLNSRTRAAYIKRDDLCIDFILLNGSDVNLYTQILCVYLFRPPAHVSIFQTTNLIILVVK